MPDVLNLPPKKPVSKMRKFLLALTILLLIVLAAAVYLYRQAQRASSYMEVAFTNYNQGLDGVNEVVAAITDEQSYLTVNEQKLKKEVKTAQQRFKKAELYFKRFRKIALTDWEIMIARYARAAIDLNLKGLKQTNNWLEQFKKEQKKLKLADAGRRKILAAFSLANEATSLINKRQYDAAEIKLSDATTATLEGEAKWQQLFNLTNDGRGQQISLQISKMKEWLSLMQGIAAAGRQKNIAQYSLLKQKKTALDDEVIKFVRSESLLNPSSWVDNNLLSKGRQNFHLFRRAEQRKLKAVQIWQKLFK